MIHRVWTLTRQDFNAIPVCIEVQCRQGIPSWDMVGLAGRAIKESRERVISALIENNRDVRPYKWTFNFSPANISKDGSSYDLAIAISMLLGIGEFPEDIQLDNCIILGELSLEGRVQSISNLMCFSQFLMNSNFDTIILPKKQLSQSVQFPGIRYIGIDNVNELCDPQFIQKNFTKNKSNSLNKHCINSNDTQNLDSNLALTSKLSSNPYSNVKCDQNSESNTNVKLTSDNSWIHPIIKHTDWCHYSSDPKLSFLLKLMVVTDRSLFLLGPPGCGKTHFAKLVHILKSPLNFEKWLECQVVHEMMSSKILKRDEVPLQMPHPTISELGFLGGGRPFHPGVISLAHNGVLILDEALEFPSRFFEKIRSSMETKFIEYNRVGVNLKIPASAQFVFTANPCPCGQYLYSDCFCTATQIKKYQTKISRALLERIDLHFQFPLMPPQNYERIDPDLNKLEFKSFLNEINEIKTLLEQSKVNSMPFTRKAEEIQIFNKILSEKSYREKDKIKNLAQLIAIIHQKVEVEAADIGLAMQFRKNYLDTLT